MTDSIKDLSAVAITGMGILSAVGQGTTVFKEALLQGRNNFTAQVFSPLSVPIIAALIKNYSSAHLLQSLLSLPTNHTENRVAHLHKMFHQLPHNIELSLIATDEAWHQAKLDKHPLDPMRVGIIVAAQNSTSHYQFDLYDKFQAQPSYISPSYALHFMDADYLGYLSDIFSIFGEGFTVGAASASGNVALYQAYQLLKTGQHDAYVVVGALADLSPMELQGFYNIGALGGEHFMQEPNKASRPFDKDSDGFIYGQATACMILESVASATKRKVPILGYMLGGAVVLDGNYLSNPSQTGEVRAMQQAIRTSGISVEQINYINTHGTSSPLGDNVELAAIESVLNTHKSAVILNSTKSIVGHCLWSSGIVEAIATIIQMQNKFVHPNLNLENPIINSSNFVGLESQNYVVKTALSNSFGFGGINSSLVFANEI